jgi:hypothetical protein
LNPIANKWTADQYDKAQKTFNDLKESSFDAWSDSRLREFLLEQGVVEPSGPRERLILLAKAHYKSYTDAASSLSSKASTAVYGDPTYQASWSISSYAAAATKEVGRQIDEGKDYVWSTWDDNRLRAYLVGKGVIKGEAQSKREEYLQLMKEYYSGAVKNVWEAWSDSYIVRVPAFSIFCLLTAFDQQREWLLSHGLIKDTPKTTREALLADMSKYYYSATDTVYSTWSDVQLKDWLVEHGITKQGAKVEREKMLKLVEWVLPLLFLRYGTYFMIPY